jgi:hypothetical protein
MITSINHIRNKLFDVKYDRIEQGLGLGVEEIDQFLRYKKGAFNLCIGHANTGKTTIILYLMLAYSMRHNLKWLIFSSENTDYSIARKILEFRTGQPIQKLPDAIIEKELEWINNHFKILQVDKLYSARSLMSEAKHILDVWKFDGMLIDPYNSLIKDPTLLRSVGAHEYDYQIASEMRLFCKDNNVSIWLNAHAVTEALRKKYPSGHEFEGMPMPCSIADVEGGGKWGNRADDVISCHRFIQSPDRWMVSDIHVVKIKETETGGRPTPMTAPISLRMMAGNVAFTVAGKDIILNSVKKKDLDSKPTINF